MAVWILWHWLCSSPILFMGASHRCCSHESEPIWSWAMPRSQISHLAGVLEKLWILLPAGLGWEKPLVYAQMQSLKHQKWGRGLGYEQPFSFGGWIDGDMSKSALPKTQHMSFDAIGCLWTKLFMCVMRAGTTWQVYFASLSQHFKFFLPHLAREWSVWPCLNLCWFNHLV